MNRLAKDAAREVRKQLITGIIQWILTAIAGLVATAGLLDWILSLSKTEVLFFRYSLALFGVGLLGLVGWILFFRTSRTLRDVQKKFDDSLKAPPHLKDNYIHDAKLGYWRHKTTGIRVCGNCLLNAAKSEESPLSQIQIANPLLRGGFALYWKCGIKDCGQRYHRDPSES